MACGYGCPDILPRQGVAGGGGEGAYRCGGVAVVFA